jgi:hypothetical protein
MQNANRLEQQSLDKSISIQQRRVEQAQRIAQNGNAEYLQQEEEKLIEIERQREESARKQIAINTALQASQLLVSITGALTAISVPGAGPALVAANIATIVAGLSTGYGLLSNLASSTPSFFEGKDFVPLGNNPKGRDTIPANLHEGEAVIQADKNAKYAPTVRAIRRGLISPDILNSISTGKLNYGAIEKAIEVKTSNSDFTEMNKKLESMLMLLSGTNKAIGGLNVNVNMDSDGFSASIMKYQTRRSKMLNA